MKKVLSLLTLVICLFVCISCGSKSKTQVFIIQYVTAPALDSANEGIVEGLKEMGFVDGDNIEITQLNPQAKADTLSQMVSKAVREGDLIFSIATPVAQACQKELVKQGKETPMFFTAVTDPVASGIIEDADAPGVNISGTSDLNPVAEQVAIIKELDPSFDELGFIYTSNEANSILQLNLAKEECLKLGVTIVEAVITNSSDITQAVTNLANNCDAVYVPTDNVVSSSMQTVARICSEHGKVTICGEENMLSDGGIISVNSVNYTELGKQTGKMGARALNGEDVKTMKVEYSSSEEIVINKDKVTEYGLSIPQALMDRSK